MKQIVTVQFEANDGSVFNTQAEAELADRLAVSVAEILAPLGEYPRLEEGEFWQHDPAVVMAARRALLDLVFLELPARVTAAAVEGALAALDRGTSNANGTLASMMISELPFKAVRSAWYRLGRIDLSGCEWDQWCEVGRRSARSGRRKGGSGPEVVR